METHTYFLILFFLLAFLASVLNTVMITKSNDYATEKYYRVAASWTYIGCILLYIMLYYYFKRNPEYQFIVLTSILMLICLPAMIVSASSAFLIGGNL